MTLDRRNLLDTMLWTTQCWLALIFTSSGLLKALLPAADLQSTFGLASAAQPGVLGPVGLVELVLALLLVLPAGARILPKLTPFAAACLGATVLLGMVQPSTAGGLGRAMPDLLLLTCTAFVTWGRLVAAPIEPVGFGPERERESSEAAARLERNRQRHAARQGGSRKVA
jgi:hypothetical protein